jgi:homoserine dehydrogenase
MVDDTPGTLAKVATVMSDLGINIESVAQNEAEQVGDVIPLIIMTHAIQEAVMNEAILAIEALESTQGKVIKIRVAQF